jgi:transcriptional regulator with XRE-family HTH domain
MLPEQCRAARGWLNWTQDDLAKAASVSLSTVRDFERGKRAPMRNNLAAMAQALMRAGITFSELGVEGKLARSDKLAERTEA